MRRLIDADALIADNVILEGGEDRKTFYEVIERQPTIEPERKKGKWIKHPEWQANGECGYECDQCGMGSDVDYDFCMRCGADMREGKE